MLEETVIKWEWLHCLGSPRSSRFIPSIKLRDAKAERQIPFCDQNLIKNGFEVILVIHSSYPRLFSRKENRVMSSKYLFQSINRSLNLTQVTKFETCLSFQDPLKSSIKSSRSVLLCVWHSPNFFDTLDDFKQSTCTFFGQQLQGHQLRRQENQTITTGIFVLQQRSRCPRRWWRWWQGKE